MLDKGKMREELRKTIEALERLEAEVERMASNPQISKYELRTRDGGLVIAPIIVAKANALAALTNITDGWFENHDGS